MTNFWTSDTHYGHTNVIRYSNRPFSSKEEMDQALINNWNAKVKPGDNVYHLGDVAFCQEDRLARILGQLNGQKFLIYGNHDKQIKRSRELQSFFVWCRDYHELSIDDADAERGRQKIVMCHYPMISWNSAHHGSWMLHGHCHGNLRYPFQGRIVDVGVDPQNYSPVSYEELKARMKKVRPEFLDHHQE
jgi:calcineurin-like phosphoesterase family protein